MRALLATVLLVTLSGCLADDASPQPPVDDRSVPGAAAGRQPVEIHEVVNLANEPTGAQRTWSFRVEEGATQAEMRFYATGKAVVGAGMPTCLTFETPAESGAAGICNGSGPGNIVISPYLVANERVFFELAADAPPGDYTFSLDAQPSATDFHAVVHVAYG